MKTSDFFYDLPDELIAQTPVEPRNSSRLMVLNKDSGEIEHRIFSELIDYLNDGDCLIMNDTRVIPARIYGVKRDTGAVVEFLLLEQKQNDVWECLCKPGKRAKIGTVFSFGDDLLRGEILGINNEDGSRFVKFSCKGNIFNVLDEIGSMPLPPYIKEKLSDKERYQTVYSREPGSAAAPTAGLHFTPEMLNQIRSKGIKTGFVTLHVGLGTFRPVKVDDVTKHHMHTEHFVLPQETADLINETKKNGKRVIAVGTTTCRTLETVARKGIITEAQGNTSIFIYPGFEFKCIDALITNFHLPESTLIMLVSAFAGYNNIMNAYRTAVEEKYRFFSFGDAMLII